MSDVSGVRGEIEKLVRTGSEQGVREISIPLHTLEAWVPRLRREAPPHRPRPASRRMTAELAQKIRELHRGGLNHQQISAQLNVNSGRVSEVLTGKK
jgi:hypothetical protein